MMNKFGHIGFLMISVILGANCYAQRTYASHSVLSSGTWFQISTTAPGIYKIDIPFLTKLGINTSNLSSSALRLFGNGGTMLPEHNSAARPDDLQEIAVWINDGGDNMFNSNDYLLFFAGGPDEWTSDPQQQIFSHRKNIYSDQSFYYLTVSSNGSRIGLSPLLNAPVSQVTHFSDRYVHEKDLVNFLNSGKEWYGEELSALPGRNLSIGFSVNLPNWQAGTPVQLKASCAARSVQATSRFDISVNGQPAGQMMMNPVAGGPYDFFASENTSTFSGPGAANSSVTFTYVPGGVNAQGWVNWFEFFGRREISLGSTHQLLFRDWQSAGNSQAEFIVAQAGSGTQVWDISNPASPVRMQGIFQNGAFRFVANAAQLREYITFDGQSFLVPDAIGSVPNQDLHNSEAADFLIIAHPTLKSEAERLALFHQQKDGLQTLVATTTQVYHEFSSGSPDPVAIRDFVKMYYDKYQAGPRPLKYLLLWGDASFDYKNRITGNTNLVPSWQTSASLHPLSSYTTDDFFGFLDDAEDINTGSSNQLDIGIGRVPAKDLSDVKNFNEKVLAYFSQKAFGPWRNNICFVADDEDQNLHLQDAELFAATTRSESPVMNSQKIYLDAFRQESSPGGSSYPLALQASNNQIFNGTLIWNFNGHGGPRRLAEETILDQETVNRWDNRHRLPLFITATCDFAPFDNPALQSLGENLLLRPGTGAIALMTTTRLVFAYSNRIMNNNYLAEALKIDPNGSYSTLGEAAKVAKNLSFQASGDFANIHKFSLLGDPALKLAFPEQKINITKVNNIPITQVDTLSAMETVVMEGKVTNPQGNILQNFIGTLYATVFDKPQQVLTLGNDPGSPVTAFETQNNILFKGKASVSNGEFRFSFKVPKDINYQFGYGRLGLYAENGIQDANGFFEGFMVGGAGTDNGTDREGPHIKIYLNDELFVNGGTSNQSPVLLLKLSDSSGINTTGTGIGHDIVATLDHDNRKFFILNDFFQADLNSYRSGTVQFQMPELEPGPHTLSIKAWDVLNNSNEEILNFTVARDEDLELTHVLNYPNPFTSSTEFWFEHNKPGLPLTVHLQVLTITGRVVFSRQEVLTTMGNRSASISWDGRDQYGDRLARGVYLYRLRVSVPGKKPKEVIQKLVIL